MRIGLTFTVRTSKRQDDAIAATNSAENGDAHGGPDFKFDDAEEEFDSPETIDAIADALAALGHDVELLADGQPLVSRLLAGELPDLVFNIAEGRGISRSREAWVPALLESLGIPYTGSDPLTLAATLDKDFAKRIVREAGVAVPAGVLIDCSAHECAAELAALPLPIIVKPVFEGSSKGIGAASVVDDHAQLHEIVAQCQNVYQQPVIVEQFIDGDELTVGVLGNAPATVVGIMRIAPLQSSGRFVYGLDVKRDWRRKVRYEIPALLSQSDEDAIRQAALTAYHALGCRDVARIDFRLCNGVPYFIEANPLPGLAPGAGDLVLLAQGMGIDYHNLIGRILSAALSRCQQATDDQAGKAAHRPRFSGPLPGNRSMQTVR